jgi:hypothetical protein
MTGEPASIRVRLETLIRVVVLTLTPKIQVTTTVTCNFHHETVSGCSRRPAVEIGQRSLFLREIKPYEWQADAVDQRSESRMVGDKRFREV